MRQIQAVQYSNLPMKMMRLQSSVTVSCCTDDKQTDDDAGKNYGDLCNALVLVLYLKICVDLLRNFRTSHFVVRLSSTGIFFRLSVCARFRPQILRGPFSSEQMSS